MTPYLALLRARFLALLQYRVAAVAGIATQAFWGFLRVMVFSAFYAAAGPQPMTLDQVVTYVWLGQATIMLVIWRPDAEVEAMVRTGSVAYELLRPVDLYGAWFARALASRAAPTILRCGPLLPLALLCFGMRPPVSVAAVLAWAAGIALALLLSAAIGALLTVSLLWTVSGRGLSILLATGAWTLSGIVLPLPLFPDGVRRVLEALPFAGLLDVPSRLWLGHIAPQDALPVLVREALWVVGLVLLGRLLVGRGLRRLVVQGG